MRSPLPDLWHLLGGDPAELGRLHLTGPAQTLRSTLPVTEAGAAAVGASLLAATLGTDARLHLDTGQLAVALRSERYLRRDGASPGSPFDPLSAFHRAADGWLRLHANYPWHRAAALRVLGVRDDIDAVRKTVERWPAVELETALYDAGGVAAAVRTEQEWRATYAHPDSDALTPRLAGSDTPTRRDDVTRRGAASLPLVERSNLAPAAQRAATGRLRVLDLTRVIAGPVATRTLAAHGADVLRIDPPQLPEIPMQAWEGLPGKRSALLDLTIDLRTLEHLLSSADVVVTGYRHGALDRFGLAPDALAERHPGLVIVTLSAWGHEGRWATRRGFDSLVQAACGIAVLEGGASGGAGGTAPGALPAQLLDHATGYLAAAGALLAVADQRATGGTPHVRLSLLATAQWLLSLPRTEPVRHPSQTSTRPPTCRTWMHPTDGSPSPLRRAVSTARHCAGRIHHRASARPRRGGCPGSVDDVPIAASPLAQADPTGFSSPLGQVVVLLALLASLTVLLRWWWHQRKR